jgi:L-seryl-tRNA(Ser) seleniumtransferase
MSHPGRNLPPLNEVLARQAVRGLCRRLRREIVVALAREALAQERELLAHGKGLRQRYGQDPPARAALLRAVELRVREAAEQLRTPKLVNTINATGVVLHTNLGRACLSPMAVDELVRVARAPVALEIDLQHGERGRRHDRVERWLCLLTGAQAGLVVNNNAAALWLAVQGLASGRRAVISRGELVAIGGSFRMPDLLRATRANVVEVGTTNRTRLSDYAAALRDGDVAVKVHPSNYRIEGYVEEVELAGLARLCRERGARLIFDAGSGSLYNFAEFGLTGEAPLASALAAGAHLVTFSGDKLLGGPQAGLLIGEATLVARLAQHPMMRALRVDKLTLAALEATLVAYAAPDRRPDLPLFDALALTATVLRRRARRLAAALAPALPAGWSVAVERSVGAVGGGSFAEQPLPGIEVAVAGPVAQDAERLHHALRRDPPHVLTRIGGGAVRVDVRTPSEEELVQIGTRIHEIWRGWEATP